MGGRGRRARAGPRHPGDSARVARGRMGLDLRADRLDPRRGPAARGGPPAGIDPFGRPCVSTPGGRPMKLRSLLALSTTGAVATATAVWLAVEPAHGSTPGHAFVMPKIPEPPPPDHSHFQA